MVFPPTIVSKPFVSCHLFVTHFRAPENEIYEKKTLFFQFSSAQDLRFLPLVSSSRQLLHFLNLFHGFKARKWKQMAGGIVFNHYQEMALG